MALCRFFLKKKPGCKRHAAKIPNWVSLRICLAQPFVFHRLQPDPGENLSKKGNSVCNPSAAFQEKQRSLYRIRRFLWGIVPSECALQGTGVKAAHSLIEELKEGRKKGRDSFTDCFLPEAQKTHLCPEELAFFLSQ